MRKIFTLALAAVALSSTANRSWDFTNWSEATVNNLKAVNAANTTWSDIEKAADSEPTEASKDNCFWQVSVEKTVIDGVLTANGVAIEETKGLNFIVKKPGSEKFNDRSLAIAVNYPTALSDYHGGAYLWLGGSGINYFTIPAVAGGATIKMGIESHKASDARGVKLLVNGAELEGPAAPTVYEEQTWTIPAGEAVDVTVQNTNGCHIYFIDVIEEAPSAHTWDFTNWSAATVNNLMAVNAANTTWSDDEKDDGSNVTNGNCFWQVSVEATVIDGVLMANGVAIEETKGLTFVVENDGKVKNRSLAIAVNYPSTSLGDYHGPAYLWLGGKQIDYFTIPAVPAGATIKMGIESHKSTDARGVKLLVNGEALEGPAAPTVYEEQSWTVPAGGAVDVTVQNTNGCHIYYIDVVVPSSVSDIEADENAPVEYYNLQGVRVANPENGIFIRRQGNKATKVMMK